MRNGWHHISGHDVYVENCKVLYGTKVDRNGGMIKAYPYRVNWKYSFGKRYADGWIACSGVSMNAFKSGMCRGTMCLM